jgi:hypothetical protein
LPSQWRPSSMLSPLEAPAGPTAVYCARPHTQPMRPSHGQALLSTSLILKAGAFSLSLSLSQGGRQPYLHMVHLFKECTQHHRAADLPCGTHTPWLSRGKPERCRLGGGVAEAAHIDPRSPHRRTRTPRCSTPRRSCGPPGRYSYSLWSSASWHRTPLPASIHAARLGVRPVLPPLCCEEKGGRVLRRQLRVSRPAGGAPARMRVAPRWSACRERWNGPWWGSRRF